MMHETYMKKALKQAELGIGFVDPNPMVGAVIVKNDRIIGEGYHVRYGERHAEVNAILNANESVEGATMYVTLEPCSHYGQTPPCSDLIIEKKIAKVVIGSLDPNPLVAGKGIQALKQAGIEVITGVLDEDNKSLNKVFFKYIQAKQPYVVMKTAMTADGKIATVQHDSKWISNAKSRRFVHEMRHQMKAIMVGVNTVKYDNPYLTVRLDKLSVSQSIRVIMDTRLEIDEHAHVVKTAKENPTIVVTTKHVSKEKIERLNIRGVSVIKAQTKDHEVDLKDAMRLLGEMGISSILLEGGSALNYSALCAGIVDEVISFIAPKIFGGKDAPTPVGGDGVVAVKEAFNLALKDVKRFDEDICLIYDVLKEENECLRVLLKKSERLKTSVRVPKVSL